MESTSMCSSTLYMSNMDVRSTLKWMTASTVTKWHHFHSISDAESQICGPTWPVEWYEGALTCPWDSIPKVQTLYIYLRWNWEVVWGGCQPQTWCIGIVFTPQVTERIPKFGANLASGMIWGCTHMPLRQHTKGSNAVYISNMKLGSGMRWMPASNMM